MQNRTLIRFDPALSRTQIVILAAEDLDHRRRFYKALRDEHCVAEFPKLERRRTRRWAGEFVQKRGYRISSSAVRKIVELAGSDLQNLAMELEKLLLYSGNPRNVPDSAVMTWYGEAVSRVFLS